MGGTPLVVVLLPGLKYEAAGEGLHYYAGDLYPHIFSEPTTSRYKHQIIPGVMN